MLGIDWRVTNTGVIAVALLFGANVGAQEYPTKTIRVIVPYAPGGAGDVMARVIGRKMSDSWGAAGNRRQ